MVVANPKPTGRTWTKPEKAEEWQAKLPRTEAVEE
jgi:hypothetical protein